MSKFYNRLLLLIRHEYRQKKKTGKSVFELDREFELDEIKSNTGNLKDLTIYLYRLNHNKSVYISEKLNLLIRGINQLILEYDKRQKALELRISQLEKKLVQK